MDEINEQTENMKQIQDALSAPLGASADFDEVIHCGHLRFATLQCIVFSDTLSTHCTEKTYRMNWKRNLKNWREQSWNLSFWSLLQLLQCIQYMSQPTSNQLALLHRKLQLKMMSLLHSKRKWHCDQVNLDPFVHLSVYLMFL